MIRRPPRSTRVRSSAASDVYKRQVYTGAIGHIAPSGDCQFNVAIRTVVLEGARGEMGIGGGIVADSKEDSEYEECLLNAHFLTKADAPFELIETLRHEKE